MTDIDHKQHIGNVIQRTFHVVQALFDKESHKLSTQNVGSRIFFPYIRNGEMSISEQELRFIFVEQLNKEILDSKWDVYYSVETPTMRQYSFSNEENPMENEKEGRSGNFDLVIYDSDLKRIALIEFKSNNPEAKDYAKDFVKLENPKEAGDLRYFIQMVKNANRQTIASIKRKIFPKMTKYYCISLTGQNLTGLILDK